MMDYNSEVVEAHTEAGCSSGNVSFNYASIEMPYMRSDSYHLSSMRIVLVASVNYSHATDSNQ